jgi:tetraacyldisaccharide 4'-kinase
MPLGPIAAPLAGLYAAVVLARRAAYDRGWLPIARAPLSTVSVGGLEAGGSGKTPVAGFLLAALGAAGRSVGLLTRGYGRRTRGLVLRAAGEAPEPAAIGDEPAMLVAAGLDLPVAACAERIEGAHALRAAGCDCAVLDDAFSHRALARDLDIVVLRGEAPLGMGRMLPWGTLREPASSLRRADVVWLHFRGAAREPPAWLAEVCPTAQVVISEASAGPVVEAHGGAPLDIRGRRLLVAAGIARPTDVAESVAMLGGQTVDLVPFPDHHPYSSGDAVLLAGAAERCGAEAVVVTAKDAVKLRGRWRQSVPLWVVGQRVVLRSGGRELASRLGIADKALVGQNMGSSPGAPADDEK